MKDRTLGTIAAALFFIAYSISTVTNIEVLPIVVGILALLAGVLLLLGR